MEKKFVGYHEVAALPFKKGDRVTIRKGVTIRTTHPQRSPSYQAGRTYKVTIHHMMSGSSDTKHEWNEATRKYDEVRVPRDNPAVEWVGEGGYWCWVDLNEIPEAMVETPQAPEPKPDCSTCHGRPTFMPVKGITACPECGGVHRIPASV